MNYCRYRLPEGTPTKISNIATLSKMNPLNPINVRRKNEEL